MAHPLLVVLRCVDSPPRPPHEDRSLLEDELCRFMALFGIARKVPTRSSREEVGERLLGGGWLGV